MPNVTLTYTGHHNRAVVDGRYELQKGVPKSYADVPDDSVARLRVTDGVEVVVDVAPIAVQPLAAMKAAAVEKMVSPKKKKADDKKGAE